jgi:CubicO group peptidase (beta-lactamase class C family)
MSGINRRQFAAAVLPLVACPASLRGASDIGAVLQEALEKRRIPAATAMVATQDKVIYSGAFGTRDSKSGVKVTVDSIFGVASMTKALTSTAAMQLVEQGKLALDVPAAKYLPVLQTVNVLRGFDSAGHPIVRPAVKPVTLRMLLSHSSGFAYDTWNQNMARYVSAVLPPAQAAKPAYPSLLWNHVPPVTICEPGSCWQYGTSADWTARLVQKASGQNLAQYFQRHIFEPLGMKDSTYDLSPSQFNRRVSTYERQSDGSLTELARKPPEPSKFYWGGSGVYSTVGDYTRFMQMFLRHGRAPGGETVLQPASVMAMATNQIGNLSAGKTKNYTGKVWQDIDFHPGATDGFGLGFLINKVAYPEGRSAGSLAWAGGWNTYFWIDPTRGICAVIMMQIQPFFDPDAIAVLRTFEQAAYRTIPRAA